MFVPVTLDVVVMFMSNICARPFVILIDNQADTETDIMTDKCSSLFVIIIKTLGKIGLKIKLVSKVL